MSRRPPEDRGAVVFLHKEGLTTAEICRRTGFERRFVRRWISRYNDSGSLADAASGGKKGLSKSVERTVEKKMRRKRHRSSRVIARERKKQKVADVSYKDSAENSAPSGIARF